MQDKILYVLPPPKRCPLLISRLDMWLMKIKVLSYAWLCEDKLPLLCHRLYILHIYADTRACSVEVGVALCKLRISSY